MGGSTLGPSRPAPHSEIMPFSMSPTTRVLSPSSETRSRFASQPLFPEDDEDEDGDRKSTASSSNSSTNQQSHDSANLTSSTASTSSSPSTALARTRPRRPSGRGSVRGKIQRHRNSSFSISPHSPLGVLLAPLSTSPLSTPRLSNSSLPSTATSSVTVSSILSHSTSSPPKSLRTVSPLSSSTGASSLTTSSSVSVSSSSSSSAAGSSGGFAAWVASGSTPGLVYQQQGGGNGAATGQHAPNPLRLLQGKFGCSGLTGAGDPAAATMSSSSNSSGSGSSSSADASRNAAVGLISSPASASSTVDSPILSLTSSKPAELILPGSAGSGTSELGGYFGGGRSGAAGSVSAGANGSHHPSASSSSSSSSFLPSPLASLAAQRLLLRSPPLQQQRRQSGPFGLGRSVSMNFKPPPTSPGANGANGNGNGSGSGGGSPGNSAFSFSSASTVTASNLNASAHSAGGVGADSKGSGNELPISSVGPSGSLNAPSTSASSSRTRGRSPSSYLLLRRRRVFSPSREPARGLGLGPLAADDDDHNGGVLDDGNEDELDAYNRLVGGRRRGSVDSGWMRTVPTGSSNGRRRSSVFGAGGFSGFSTDGSIDDPSATDAGDGRADDDDEAPLDEGVRGRRRRSARPEEADQLDCESYAARINNYQQQMGGRLWSRFAFGGSSAPSTGSSTTTATSTHDHHHHHYAAGPTQQHVPGTPSRSPHRGLAAAAGRVYSSSANLLRAGRDVSPKRVLGALLPSAAVSTMPAPRLSRAASTASSTSTATRTSGSSAAASVDGNGVAAAALPQSSGGPSSPAFTRLMSEGKGLGPRSLTMDGRRGGGAHPSSSSDASHQRSRRNSHSNEGGGGGSSGVRLASGLRSLVKLPNLLFEAAAGLGRDGFGGGSTSPQLGSSRGAGVVAAAASASGRSSADSLSAERDAGSNTRADDAQWYDESSTAGVGAGADQTRVPSNGASSSRRLFGESSRRSSFASSSSGLWSGRGVVSPLEGDSDPGAYVFGLGLPVDPDTEFGSVVQLQTFRTGHGFPFTRSRTLSLDTGAAAAHKDAASQAVDIIAPSNATSNNARGTGSSGASSLREPPNVHRGSLPEGNEVAELLARSDASFLGGDARKGPQLKSSAGSSPSSSASSSSDALAVRSASGSSHARRSSPSSGAASTSSASGASGVVAFWNRPSRPAAEGVPQNYSAFRSRQRAGIRKGKDTPSPTPSQAHGAVTEDGPQQQTPSATNSSAASLRTVGTSASSEFSADSSSLSSHGEEERSNSSDWVTDDGSEVTRTGRSRLPHSASVAGNATSAVGTRSRDPSPPSQHAVGLYSGGGFCAPRRLSADAGDSSLLGSIRRSKSNVPRSGSADAEDRPMRASQSASASRGSGFGQPVYRPRSGRDEQSDAGSADAGSGMSTRGRSPHHHSPTDASSDGRGRANGVKALSPSPGPSGFGRPTITGGDNAQGRSRSRLLGSDLWKAAGSIAKPRPAPSPSPNRRHASPSRKSKPIAPAGRLSSPPGFRPRVAPRPLPIGGPPPMLPRSDAAGPSGSRAMHAAAAAAAAAAASGSAGAGGGNPCTGPQMSGSPGPGSRLSLMSNNKHLLMLSLELEMMRKRKILAPLKPRAFVVRWIKQQQQQLRQDGRQDRHVEDMGRLQIESDDEYSAGAQSDRMQRPASTPPRLGRTHADGGASSSHVNLSNSSGEVHIPAASEGMRTPELKARILLAGGSSLRYEVQPDIAVS